jgi:hypothetical protein
VSGSTKLVMVGLMLVLAIGSTAWCASGDESSSEASGHAIGPNGTGVTAVLPPGWRGDVTPSTFGRILLATPTVEPDADEPSFDECEAGYRKRLTLSVFDGRGLTAAPSPVKRPEAFTKRFGRLDQGEGSDTCYVHFQFGAFRDRGRTLSFQLDIGKDVTDAQLQEAYAILDSIHVAPSKHA